MSPDEFAQQLAVRIQQLIALHQIWIEVQAARLSRRFVSDGDSVTPLSDNVLYVLILSMLYSVFDDQPSAVNLERLNPRSGEFSDEISKILEGWRQIKAPIKRIRHRFAFHGSATKDGTENAVNAMKELGDGGSAIAWELIEKLRQLYPWLVLEARSAYALPAQWQARFREFLEFRRRTQQAILEIRRGWNDGTSLPKLELAAGLQREAADVWASVRTQLVDAARPREEEVFVEVWTADLTALGETIESLKRLRLLLESTEAMSPSSGHAVQARESQGEALLRYLTTVSSALPFWKGLIRAEPDVASAFSDLEESVSRLTTALHARRN